MPLATHHLEKHWKTSNHPLEFSQILHRASEPPLANSFIMTVTRRLSKIDINEYSLLVWSARCITIEAGSGKRSSIARLELIRVTRKYGCETRIGF